MSRRPENPLRPLLEEERERLIRSSRSQVIATSQVARAKAILMIADGRSHTDAHGQQGGDPAMRSRLGQPVSIPKVWQRWSRDAVGGIDPTTRQKNANEF